MDRIQRLDMLVRATDGGSFAAAAKALDLTPSAVSKGIGELEQAMQVSLFNRTTRRLQLTEDGRKVYEQAQDILRRMTELEDGVASRRQQITGTVCVGLSAALNRHVIMPRLAPFLDQHADLKIKLCLTQDSTAMLTDNIDVMLHVGEPPASRLVARLLVQGRPAVYASPDYVQRHGAPSCPNALVEHRCLVFRPPWLTRPYDEWHFMDGAVRKSVRITPRIVSHDREGLIVAAIAGAGLIYMACFDPAPIRTGQLRRLMPQWPCGESFNVYALHRRTTRPVPRIAAFLEFVQDAFADFDPDEITIKHAPRAITRARRA